MKENDLILSTTFNIENSLPLNNMLFLSFQISHTVANQSTCIIDRHALAPALALLNWLKWSAT